MNRLVATAKRPETEMACPAMPTVAPRSRAIGVRRLTGMNSAAISSATHIPIEATAPQVPTAGVAEADVVSESLGSRGSRGLSGRAATSGRQSTFCVCMFDPKEIRPGRASPASAARSGRRPP